MTFGKAFGAATVAGYDGPGFHNWPSGHIPQDTAPNPLLRIQSTAKKTFGEAFGAAAVAGYAGPGFHTWPSGHIPQDNGSESASPQPVTCQKDVRRRDRGQRPTATVNLDTKPRRRVEIPKAMPWSFTGRPVRA